MCQGGIPHRGSIFSSTVRDSKQERQCSCIDLEIRWQPVYLYIYKRGFTWANTSGQSVCGGMIVEQCLVHLFQQ